MPPKRKPHFSSLASGRKVSATTTSQGASQSARKDNKKIQNAAHKYINVQETLNKKEILNDELKQFMEKLQSKKEYYSTDELSKIIELATELKKKKNLLKKINREQKILNATINNTNLNSELNNLNNNNEDVMDELASASSSGSSTSSALVEEFDEKFIKQFKKVQNMKVTPEEAQPVTDYLQKLNSKLSKYGNPRPFTTLIDHDLEILRSIQLYAPDSNPNLNPEVKAIFERINPQFLNFRNISVESFLKKTQDIKFLKAYLDIRSDLIEVKNHIDDKKLKDHLEFIEKNSKDLHKECRTYPGKMQLASKPGDEVFATNLQRQLENSKLFNTIFKKGSKIHKMYEVVFNLANEIQELPIKLVGKGIKRPIIKFIVSYTFGRMAIFANILLQHLLLILNTVSPIDRSQIEPLIKEAEIELADILDFKIRLVLDPKLMVPMKIPGPKRGGAYVKKTIKRKNIMKKKSTLKRKMKKKRTMKRKGKMTTKSKKN